MARGARCMRSRTVTRIRLISSSPASPCVRLNPEPLHPPHGVSAMPWLIMWSFSVTVPTASCEATCLPRRLLRVHTDALRP